MENLAFEGRLDKESAEERNLAPPDLSELDGRVDETV